MFSTCCVYHLLKVINTNIDIIYIFNTAVYFAKSTSFVKLLRRTTIFSPNKLKWYYWCRTINLLNCLFFLPTPNEWEVYWNRLSRPSLWCLSEVRIKVFSSAPNGWVDLKFGILLYIDWAYVVSGGKYCAKSVLYVLNAETLDIYCVTIWLQTCFI